MFPLASSVVTPDGITIYQFNGDVASKMVYRWKSKLYLLRDPTAFLKAQVKSLTYTNTVIRFYRQGWSQVYQVWQDVPLREVVVESEDLITLPMNQDYTRFWWEVLSTDTIETVQIVEDAGELT